MPLPTLVPALRRTLAALLVGACFAGVHAAPTTPQVVQGQATFSQQGNVFSITNTPNTVINWQSFSVNAGEITRFIQQSGDSAVLNRIVGQDPSQILGALQSNGHVFLINPNGILFGRDARVDVNGLTASTLAMSDADFLSGKRQFGGAGSAGSIVNQGSITTPSGGQVFLIAASVDNSGIITSPQGQVVLAAGHTVQLVDSSNPSLHVVVSAPADQAINLGQVIAQGGKVGIFGALVNQRGVVNANSAQLGANGKIVLRASGEAMLGAGSSTSATGTGSGGQVTVEGARVGMTGNALIDVSGATGGGSVLFGGGYQGKNPLVKNARQALLGANASIRADALNSGNGGTVVLWSDASTRAVGSISARGGALGGNGGLIETSGKYLDVNGIRVLAGAARGNNGTWLLDPYDIEVVANGGFDTLANVDQFADPMGVAHVNAATLSSVASGTNIVLQATNDVTFNAPINPVLGSGSLMVDAGNNITVNAPISTSGGAVTLTANHPAYASGSGMVTLAGGGSLSTGGGNVTLTASEVWVGAALTTGNGSLIVNGGNRASFEQNVDTGNGSLSVTANDILFGGGGTSVAAGNAVAFNTTGGIFTLGPNWRLTSPGQIAIKADAVTLAGTIGGLQTVRPDIGFTTYTAGRGIDIVSGGMDGASTLRLDPASLAALDAASITIGNAAYDGDIHVLSEYGAGLAQSMTLRTQGGIYVDQPITMPAGAQSSLNLLIDGTSPGAGITTARDTGNPYAVPGGRLAAGNVALQANNITLGASITAAGEVALTPHMPTAQITLGAGAQDGIGMLGLDDMELNLISAGGLRIGGNSGQSGGLTVTSGGMDFTSILGSGGPLRLTGGLGDLTLDGTLVAPGKLYLDGNALKTANAGIARSPSMVLSARAGIGSNATPFNTDTGMLSAVNQRAGGEAPINIANTGTLNLGSIRQGGSGNEGAIRIANVGGMTLLAIDPATDEPVSVATTGDGTISLITRSPLTVNGNISSEEGAITLEAGDGGVLTIGASASVSTDEGDIGLIGGSVVNDGSVLTNDGDINVVAVTVSGNGTYSAPGGTVSGVPNWVPSVARCLVNAALPGCTAVLRAALDACVINPSGSNCIALLPALAVCVAAPATYGCSVILPSVPTCIAAPATAGCAVVLPTLSACIASPSTAGCTVVLPSLPACTAAPATAGCSVVLPTLTACTAAPSTAGCSTVLPTLPTCTAAPATAGCTVVLPSVSVCTAAPATAGCSAVLPTMSACIAAPYAPGCSAVLPTLAACTAAPTGAGCSVVLPALATCIAAPAGPGCSAVLPLLSVCTAAPATAGCSAVLPSLSACLAAPTTAGCVAVLPAPAACSVNPAAPGCASVAPTLSVCIAAPSTAGCSAVLPSLSACTAAPATPGCAVVLPTMAQCVASPTLQGCSAILPTLALCAANPTAPGCTVVTAPALSAPNSELDTALKTTLSAVDSSSKLALSGNASEDKKDDGTQAGVSTVQGEKKNESIKKTYCN